MKRAIAIALIVAGCGGGGKEEEPPPRHYLQGGAWLPAATGWWLHQYATSDDVERLMTETGFACTDSGGGQWRDMRCERGFRVGKLVARTDTVDLTFRRNGAVASASSTCQYTWLDGAAWHGTCTPFSAPGAVYPDLDAFRAMVETMLRPARIGTPISMVRVQPGAAAPLPDAQETVDRLARWLFECDPPAQRYTPGFRGREGEVREATCRQWSLRTASRAAQRQEVVLRYDTADLAVLGVAVRLDDASVTLPAFERPRDLPVAKSGPAGLVLETTAGERFEMPWAAVGTGSRDATRAGFVTLTAESQRRLVQAYLDKQAGSWPRPLEQLSHASFGALEWYGPEALPHVEALLGDERPEVGAALIKYLCFESPLRMRRGMEDIEIAREMTACMDRLRARVPRSIEAFDRLLAGNLRTLANMDGRSLDAYLDFRRDVVFVYALGKDGRASGVALDETVAGKELSPRLDAMVAAALSSAQRR
jgi:hypothetical protein